MTIKELKLVLAELEETHGDIDNVTLNFRHDQNSDIHTLGFLYEDLFKEDNTTLDSVVFTTQEWDEYN
jgi:hypothetical protein